MGKSSHWHECCILVYRCVYVSVCLLLCLSICLYLFTYLPAVPSYCYSFRTWHNRGNCTRPSDIKYSWQRDTEFQRLFLEVSTNHGMKYMRKCQYMLGENITGTSPLLSIKKVWKWVDVPATLSFNIFIIHFSSSYGSNETKDVDFQSLSQHVLWTRVRS